MSAIESGLVYELRPVPGAVRTVDGTVTVLQAGPIGPKTWVTVTGRVFPRSRTWRSTKSRGWSARTCGSPSPSASATRSGGRRHEALPIPRPTEAAAIALQLLRAPTGGSSQTVIHAKRVKFGRIVNRGR